MPSAETSTVPAAPTATYSLLPQLIALRPLTVPEALDTQSLPFVEVRMIPASPTATNCCLESFQTTCQNAYDGATGTCCTVQLIASGDVRTVEKMPTPTYLLPFQ